MQSSIEKPIIQMIDVIRAGSRQQLGDPEGAKQDKDKMSEIVHKQIY